MATGQSANDDLREKSSAPTLASVTDWKARGELKSGKSGDAPTASSMSEVLVDDGANEPWIARYVKLVLALLSSQDAY